MELLILLVVVGLLAGLILGPIGFVRSLQAGQKLAGLEAELERQSVELQSLRTLCLRLREGQQTQQPTTTDDAAGPQAAEPVEQAEPDTAPPAVETKDDNAFTTLEHLLELRRGRPSTDEHTAATAEDAPEIGRTVESAEPEASDSISTELEPIASPIDHAPASDSDTADAARRLSIEEVLAGKVFVWIGAIALVLTAAFLLKLGFDRDIITEPVRVLGAAAFGIALWCVGEWARGRVVLIAQALCGAAVAVLYTSVLAGHNLYGLFGPSGETIAFTLMATITAAAILLSLRHGPAVAILGMLGGFMLPPLLAQDFGRPTAGMVLYLIAIEAGVLAVTGRRGWFGISAMTLLFTIAWSLGYTLIGDNPTERTLTAFLVLGTAGAYLFHTARIHRDPASSASTRRRVLGLSIAATCSAIGVVALLAVKGNYTPRDLSTLGMVALGTLILARLDTRQIAMPFVAMALSLLVLFTHAAQTLPAPPSNTFLTLTTCFGVLFTFGGYACLWGSQSRKAFAALAAIAGPSFLGLTIYASHGGQDFDALRAAWWPYTLGLAVLYALAVIPTRWRRKAEHDWPTALFAVLSFVLFCITLAQALNHPWLAVTLALVSAAAAIIDWQLFIRPLRVAAVTAASVAAILLVVPGPFDLTVHGVAVFNTLLPMYLLPAIAFGIIAWCASQAGSGDTARRMTHLTVGNLAALLLVLTRNIFQPNDFAAETFSLYEWSTYAGVLLLAAYLGHWLGTRMGFAPIHEAVRGVIGIAAAIALFGGLLPSNPVIQQGLTDTGYTGMGLAFGLIALYILPAALLWQWSSRQALAEHRQLANPLRVIAVTLVTLFVGLQIRNAYHPGHLDDAALGIYECATYGLAWVGVGLALYRIATRISLPATTAQAGQTIFGLGLATLLVGNVLILNPLWHEAHVGTTPALNGLWILYGPTILILALLARQARQHKLMPQAKLAGFAAIAIAFMLLCMLVRHGFAGDGYALIASNLDSSERYAYSLAWVLFGGALLIAGVFTRLDTLRYGSLAVLLLAVGKVFLIDTANLDNLYRVFSFFGLGVTLIGLGYLYQRLVFKQPRSIKPEKQSKQ